MPFDTLSRGGLADVRLSKLRRKSRARHISEEVISDEESSSQEADGDGASEVGIDSQSPKAFLSGFKGICIKSSRDTDDDRGAMPWEVRGGAQRPH